MIVIIGATKGIGRVIAHRFSNRDELLVLSGRDTDSLTSLYKEIKVLKDNVFIEPIDISKPESIDKFIEKLSCYNEPLEGLINTAASFYRGTFFDESQKSIEELLATTFAGPVLLISKVLKHLKLAVPCDIINITSVGAATNLDSSKSSAFHITTKAAIHLFGVITGRELASSGVRFCNIAPGTFARNGRTGIPENSIADTVEFIFNLPPEMYIESIVMRPTGK